MVSVVFAPVRAMSLCAAVTLVCAAREPADNAKSVAAIAVRRSGMLMPFRLFLCSALLRQTNSRAVLTSTHSSELTHQLAHPSTAIHAALANCMIYDGQNLSLGPRAERALPPRGWESGAKYTEQHGDGTSAKLQIGFIFLL